MPRPPPPPLEGVLAKFTCKEAQHAIYFDYEGIPTQEPIILGWRIDGHYSAAIIDDDFDDCSSRYRAKAATSMSHKAAARHILQRATDEERHLVCWSWHDYKIIWLQFGRRERAKFLGWFVNAIRIARPWHYRTFGCVPPKGARMSYFADAFSIRIPPQYGDKIVANHLNAVRKALARKGTYAALGKAERAKWVAVIKHNKTDLEVTNDIVSRILRNQPHSPHFSPCDP